jgi:ATP-binding cassette subfamily B protein RaxB
LFFAQYSIADCGYVCIAALLTHFKQQAEVHTVKAFVGTTERGLTLSQLNAALRKVGADTTAIAFDPSRSECFPCPGVVLLRNGHYLALLSRSGDVFSVHDPLVGERLLGVKHFEFDSPAFGIEVRGISKSNLPNTNSPDTFLKSVKNQIKTRLGIQVLLLGAIAQSLVLILPLLTQRAVDSLLPAQPQSDFSMAALAFVLIALIGNWASVVSGVGNRIVSNRSSLSVGSTVFDQLATKGTDWFQSRPASYAQSQYRALTSIQQYYGELPSQAISMVLFAIVGIIAVIYLSPWLMLPSIVGILISAGLDRAFRYPQQRNTASMLQETNTLTIFFNDVVSQVPLFVRFGSLKRARARYRRRIRRSSEIQLGMTRLNGIRSAIGSLFSTLENLIFVCLASYFVKTENYSLGTFVAAGLYKDQLATALSMLFRARQQYALLQPQRQQMAELLSVEAPRPAPELKVTEGRLTVREVDFRYGSLDPWVLRGVTLDIEQGSFMLVNGPSGSGKSTLLKLICGAAEPTSGSICIDGKPVQRFMNGLGAVLQTDRLITDTVRENILMFRRRNSGSEVDTDIWNVLELVGLADFVQSLPMGLNTGIGENMTGLSGGQRQKILLARALLFSPKILVLDEATSSLDVESEATFFSKTRDLGMTLVVSSHRPEVWRLADSSFNLTL